MQDVVIAGIDRDEIGILVFPRLDACRALAGLPANAPPHLVLGDAGGARILPAASSTSLHASGTGSATRVARALVLAEPPSIDRGEITDKGSINQRAVLTHRAADVERMYLGRDRDVLAAARSLGPGEHGMAKTTLHRVTVQFGDCDPAGIVFYPNF